MYIVIKTPKQRATLLIGSNLLWFASIPAQYFYLNRNLLAGAYPVNGDNIIIPLFGWAMVALIACPVLNTVWWWLSRRYPGSVSVFVRAPRRVSAQIVSLCLIALTLFLCFGVVSEFFAEASEAALVMLTWCYLPLAYRAAFLQRAALSKESQGLI
jgi:hypothetical protein